MLGLAYVAGPRADAIQGDRTVALSVSIESESATNCVVKINLTNPGPDILLIPQGSLPWDQYGMTIAPIECDPYSTPLKQVFPIADPPPLAPHQLKSKETMSGRFDLVDRFPSLPERIKRNDIVLFWSYKCPAENAKVARVSGCIDIPQRK